jgi:hypothetical protein
MAMLPVLPIAVANSTLSEAISVKIKARISRFLCLDVTRSNRLPVNAFTLLELVISIAISVAILFVAATIAVSELRTSIKLYVYQSLRDQMARITFLIESEVGEASSFVDEPAACAGQRVAGTDTFLFAIRHSYLQGPSFTGSVRNAPPAASTICYFNRRVSALNANPQVFDLFRFGPPFDAATGVLSAGASAATLVSPGTRLLNSAGNTGVNINNSAANWPDFATCTDCDGHTLRYSISLQHDIAANATNQRVWSHVFAPVDANNNPIRYTARILSFCVSSNTAQANSWCAS